MNHGDIDRFIRDMVALRATSLDLVVAQYEAIGALVRFQEAWGGEIPLELE